MSSFLVTSKMSPELAARVETSVRGKRRVGTRPGFGPRIPLAAWLPCTAVLVVIGLAMLNSWIGRRELERARAELLARVDSQRASMPQDASGFLPSARSWVARVAGPYEGDLIVDELRTPGALQARLAQPGLFIRANQSKLGNPDQLLEAASGSVKDAVLLCLSDPPESRSEQSLLHKVRKVNFGAVLPSIRRFYDAEAGLGLLQPQWESKVREATDLKRIHTLSSELGRAPIDDGKEAAKAELLLVVVDEPPQEQPNDERRPEERAHAVRLALVALRSQALLLRMRRVVDPSAYSASMRAAHAHAITGCLMSMEVREAAGASVK